MTSTTSPGGALTPGTAPSISGVPILTPPYKSTNQVNWDTPLSNYIVSSYSDDPNNYSNEFSTLHKLRQDMRGASSTADITARDVLLKYFGQLELLELHFPMDDGSVEIPFEWFDAFTHESVTQSSLAFEKACTIYNIATTLARLAATTPRDIKRAYHNLQVSAGLFKFINDNFLHAPSRDLNRETIKFLSDLMHAQAQEILFEKNLIDKAGKVTKMSCKVTAGLCHLFIQLAAQCAQGTNLAMYIDSGARAIPLIIAIKSKLYSAHAFIHRAVLAQIEAHYGEGVARLAAAITDLTDAERWVKSLVNSSTINSQAASSGIITADGISHLVEVVKTSLAIATDMHHRANKDNDVIYHESVPSRDSLAPLDQILIPEFLGFDHILPGGAQELQLLVGNDIFSGLIPMHVHEKASVYSEQKATVLRSATELANMLDGETASALTALGFPDALENLSQCVQDQTTSKMLIETFPQVLVTMINEISSRQIPDLNAILSDIIHVSQTNLEQAQLELDTDQVLEVRIKGISPTAWTLPSSSSLIQRQNLDRVRNTLRTLVAQNEIIYSEYDTYIVKNPILNVSHQQRGQQQAPQPSLLDLDVGNDTSDLVIQIRTLRDRVAQLNALKREREAILNELKLRMQDDDISDVLVLNSKQNIDNHIFRSELAKYTVLTDKLKATTATTRSIVKEVQITWNNAQAHPRAREVNKQAENRNKLIKDIEAAYAVHQRILKNLTEAVQSTSDIQDQCSKLNNDIKEIVSKRKKEAEKLEQSAVTSRTQSQAEFLRQQLARMDVNPHIQSTNSPHSHIASPTSNSSIPSLPGGYPSATGGMNYPHSYISNHNLTNSSTNMVTNNPYTQNGNPHYSHPIPSTYPSLSHMSSNDGPIYSLSNSVQTPNQNNATIGPIVPQSYTPPSHYGGQITSTNVNEPPPPPFGNSTTTTTSSSTSQGYGGQGNVPIPLHYNNNNNNNNNNNSSGIMGSSSLPYGNTNYSTMSPSNYQYPMQPQPSYVHPSVGPTPPPTTIVGQPNPPHIYPVGEKYPSVPSYHGHT